MIPRLAIALLFAGLLPASALAAGDPPAQRVLYQDSFFYSGGHSYLGVDIRDITSDRVSTLKLKEERGVEVIMVDQDSPAGKAGLKEHDVILDYNGAKVESDEQLRRLLRETPPGRTVTLGISRDGNAMSIKVQLADRDKAEADTLQQNRDRYRIVMPPRVPEIPEMEIPFDVQITTYTPSLGIQIESLNQQLGQYFGVKDGEGLLVKSVEKGSVAEKAGLKAGDVITRGENEKVSDRTDLRRILRSHSGGKVTLSIVRDKREQNLIIDLPARKDSSGMELVLPDMDTFDDMHSTLLELAPKLKENIATTRIAAAKARVALQSAEVQKALRNSQDLLRENLKKLKLEMVRSRFI